MGRNSEKLASLLSTPNVIKEVESMIEEDLVMLGKLLGCNREVTCQFMHSVVASMLANRKLFEESLLSAENRTVWETGFDQMVKVLGSDVKQSVLKYIEAHRGRHELTELLEERRLPPFPGAMTTFSRFIYLFLFLHFSLHFFHKVLTQWVCASFSTMESCYIPIESN